MSNTEQPLATWLKTARQEADTLKASAVEPVHLLLALTVQEHRLTDRLMSVWQMDRERLRQLARKLHPVDKANAGGKPLLSMEARQVLWAADQRAAYAARSVELDDIFYVLMGRYWPLHALWKLGAINWAATDRALLENALIPHTGEVFRDLNFMFDDEILSNLIRRIGLI